MNDILERQQRLVARLRDAACFPHPCGEISLIETHISFVLLTGGFAYKLKKAVNLGFVDYTTLEQRHYFCEEELRLNTRLAPDVYLDVVPITGSEDAPRIGGHGEALEYAVKMHEFSQAHLLDRMVEAGTLVPGHLDRLAETLAQFHAAAPVVGIAPERQDFGTPAAIRAPMIDNFATIRRLLGTGCTGFPAVLEQWSLQEWERRTPVFRQRRSEGRVRECHGDLHSGNMVLLDDRVEVFDAIEFNPALRWIDVIDEVAFLAMDLEERGHPDYAWRFLNAYLAITGDYAGMSVFDFYRAHRATVRAKVALTRAMQAEPDSLAAEAAWAGFRSYIRCAQRIAVTHQPVLMLTHGFAGSGKTHVALAVLEAVGAVHLRSDVERKRLHGLQPLARSGSGLRTGLYSEAATFATYEHLGRLARAVLAAGHPVIVDAAFLQRWQREQFRALAAELGVPWLIIACHAPQPILTARILERGAAQSDASEASLAVLASQQAAANPLSGEELRHSVVINTATQLADRLATSLARRFGRGALSWTPLTET